jgi:hypothetical protein
MIETILASAAVFVKYQNLLNETNLYAMFPPLVIAGLEAIKS